MNNKTVEQAYKEYAAALTKEVELDMRSVIATATITLTHTRNVYWRIWLSIKLLSIAGWIAPFEIDIED